MQLLLEKSFLANSVPVKSVKLLAYSTSSLKKTQNRNVPKFAISCNMRSVVIL